jgi:GNAT superfamily N-acetyltransferase
MTWDLPERVKRLSLPSYRYTALDFEHLNMVVAEDATHNIMGVAAWEQADPKDPPKEKSALLLHGIYVDPFHCNKGIGRQLFLAAEQAVKEARFDGLLVKAQAGATGFFLAMGMQLLPLDNPKQQYANRFWKSYNNELN